MKSSSKTAELIGHLMLSLTCLCECFFAEGLPCARLCGTCWDSEDRWLLPSMALTF